MFSKEPSNSVSASTQPPRAPGVFILVSVGVGHIFGNTSDQPARVLIIHAPAADRYFAELHVRRIDPPAVPEFFETAALGRTRRPYRQSVY